MSFHIPVAKSRGALGRRPRARWPLESRRRHRAYGVPLRYRPCKPSKSGLPAPSSRRRVKK